MSWDALAAHYDDLDEAKKAHSAFMDHIKATLPTLDFSGLRVLEFGCGTASKAIECAHLGATEITCADASASMLAQVQKKVDALPEAFRPRFRTFLLKPEDRGSDLQGEFDLILVPFVLHHIPDFKPVLENLLHLASKKAIIIISEFGFGSAFQSSPEFRELRGIYGKGFTPDQFLTFLQTHGFKQLGSTSEGVLDGAKMRAEREKLRLELGLPDGGAEHQSHDHGHAHADTNPTPSNASHIAHHHEHHKHGHGDQHVHSQVDAAHSHHDHSTGETEDRYVHGQGGHGHLHGHTEEAGHSHHHHQQEGGEGADHHRRHGHAQEGGQFLQPYFIVTVSNT